MNNRKRRYIDLEKSIFRIFIYISMILLGLFIYISNSLVKEFSNEEQNRMEVWANAITLLSSGEELSSSTVDLIFSVLQGNKAIPVLVLNQNDEIVMKSNVDSKSETPTELLKDKFKKNQPIEIFIAENEKQYLYYDDSLLLKKLSYYPYILLSVLLIFIIIIYAAILNVKKAEQNQVWIGLSKETAHQLGTPISSLMAWIELLKLKGLEDSITNELNKDVDRLQIVADRFSKIGSDPKLETRDISVIIEKSIEYISKRTSDKIKFELEIKDPIHNIAISSSLMEWVFENLYKNAIDAIDRSGTIFTRVFEENQKLIIEIADSGKVIRKENFKNIFKPGFTTKSRGWGLGLTLVKRIIEKYHRGKIFIKSSELNSGTTFRMELPID